MTLTLKQKEAILEAVLPGAIHAHWHEHWPKVFKSLSKHQCAYMARLCKRSNAEWHDMFEQQLPPVDGFHRKRYDRACHRHAVRFVWHSQQAATRPLKVNMTPTAQEQYDIVAAAYPERLSEVLNNIDYLRLMTNDWLMKTPWTVRTCPKFSDVCNIVLGGDDSISKDLYGYDEASLRSLVLLHATDNAKYEQATKIAAVAWLWDTLELSEASELTPLPDGFMDAL